MKAHHTFKKSCDDYSRGASMGAQTPETAGSFRTPEPYCALSNATCVESMAGALDGASPTSSSSSWHSSETTQYERELQLESRDELPDPSWSTCATERAIPEQLADLLMEIIPGMRGAELREAFLYATDLPPVTKQSLSELDGYSITNNITLRHDINFDKDLSYRPNFDGPKGQEKRRHSDMYWRALAAELELYAWLLQGNSSLRDLDQAKWATFVQHAQRRIPAMFRTLHEILENLVPACDHATIYEHFDVSMLMQEIERGVCDLVKRVEWVAILLKEHCAPMRDGLVDKMVQTTKIGVATNNTSHIVTGLKELMGILEVMKLDVANHHIRNLKTQLIEETINFEKYYHLDRLVNRRSKVDMDAAQKWWGLVSQRSQKGNPTAKNVPHFQLEGFTQAVVDHLFAQDNMIDLPDTFYLDKNRLWALQMEIDDLVHFEICFDVFGQCLKGFGYNGTVPDTARSGLRNALSAIVGEHAGHTPESWIYHSESLSLEIYRQAILLAGLQSECDSHELRRAHEHLQMMFQDFISTYAFKVRAAVLSQVLACVKKYHNASPIALFNSLVARTLPASLPLPPQSCEPSPQLSTYTLTCFADRLADISHRVTHITILHWRVWSPIAYITDNDTTNTTIIQHSMDSLPPGMPRTTTTRAPQNSQSSHIQNAHVRNKQLSISTISSPSPSSPHLLRHPAISAPTPPPTLHSNPPPATTATEPALAGVKRENSVIVNLEKGEEDMMESEKQGS